jgi:phosphoribosylamine--glycine ligase
MGDPETEVVIPRLKNDIVDLFIATHEGRLAGQKIETDPRVATTVMAVSKGYPGHYDKGFEIEGLDVLAEDDVHVFHAGTTSRNGKILTNGGRVLAVTAYGANIPAAAARSVKIMEFIHYAGITYRRDIGYEFA